MTHDQSKEMTPEQLKKCREAFDRCNRHLGGEYLETIWKHPRKGGAFRYAWKACLASQSEPREPVSEELLKAARALAWCTDEYQAAKQQGTFMSFYEYWMDERKRRTDALKRAVEKCEQLSAKPQEQVCEEELEGKVANILIEWLQLDVRTTCYVTTTQFAQLQKRIMQVFAEQLAAKPQAIRWPTEEQFDRWWTTAADVIDGEFGEELHPPSHKRIFRWLRSFVEGGKKGGG